MAIKDWYKKTVAVRKERQARATAKKLAELSAIEKKYDMMLREEKEKKDNTEKPKFITTKTIITFWLIWLLIVYVWYLAKSTLSILYMILAAFVISMILDNTVKFFAKKMPRWLAIAISYFLILVFIGVISFTVVPFFFTQLAEALKLWLDQITKFQDLMQTKWLADVIKDNLRLPAWIKEYVVENFLTEEFMAATQTALQGNISQIISAWSTYVASLWTFAVKMVTGVVLTLSQAIIMFVLAVFFSIEKETVIKFISWLAGDSKNQTYVKLQKMYAKLGLWIKGQFIVCLYVGVMVGILFAVAAGILWLTIPNIWTLATIAWLMNFIPYVWAFIWMTIAFFVTLLAWGRKVALLVLWIYILVNQSENNILTPIIMNKTLGVSPLLIFISMLLGWALFGFMWVLLAVPIAVILTLAFEHEE